MSKWIEDKFEKEMLEFMYRKNTRLTKVVASKIPGAVRNCRYLIFNYRRNNK